MAEIDVRVIIVLARSEMELCDRLRKNTYVTPPAFVSRSTNIKMNGYTVIRIETRYPHRMIDAIRDIQNNHPEGFTIIPAFDF